MPTDSATPPDCRKKFDFRTSSEVRSITLAMVWPWASPDCSVRRIIISRVPFSISALDGVFRGKFGPP